MIRTDNTVLYFLSLYALFYSVRLCLHLELHQMIKVRVNSFKSSIFFSADRYKAFRFLNFFLWLMSLIANVCSTVVLHMFPRKVGFVLMDFKSTLNYIL